MRLINARVLTGLLLLIFIVLLSYFFLDIPIAHYCRTLGRGVRNFFGIISNLGESTWYLVGAFALFLIFKRFQYPKIYAQQALFIFASIAASGILVNILKVICGRYRPEMLVSQGLYGFAFLQFQSEFLSFPSGHAATAFSLAGALSYPFAKFRIFLFAFAILVAMSRVIITSHYLSDVIMGAYIGFLTVYFIRKIFLNAWASFER